MWDWISLNFIKVGQVWSLVHVTFKRCCGSNVDNIDICFVCLLDLVRRYVNLFKESRVCKKIAPGHHCKYRMHSFSIPRHQLSYPIVMCQLLKDEKWLFIVKLLLLWLNYRGIGHLTPSLANTCCCYQRNSRFVLGWFNGWCHDSWYRLVSHGNVTKFVDYWLLWASAFE